MKKEAFYEQSYYDLSRIKREVSIISLLNTSKLLELIKPFLKILSDKIYLYITTKEKFTEFEALLKNSETVNQEIKKVLSNNDMFQKIDDPGISANLFSDALIKLSRRVFLDDRYNDEKYILQTQIHEWLEENLAKTITSDDRFKSVETINALFNHLDLLHKFYSSFIDNIPANWITDNIESWTVNDGDFSNILEHLRTFRENYFIDYTENLKKIKDFPKLEYIFESTRFSDYAYFNDEFSFKNTVLLQNNIDAWILFWDNLKLPLLQNIAFHQIRNPETILTIIQRFSKKSQSVKSDEKVLAFLLLRNLFDASLRAFEKLSFYGDDKGIENLSEFEKYVDIINQGKKYLSRWNNDLISIFLSALNASSKILTPTEISEWVFSYSYRKDALSKVNYFNSIIDILLVSYRSYFIATPSLSDTKSLTSQFNLQKFNFIVTNLEKFPDSTKLSEELMNNLITFINSDDFYWDYSFSEPYWITLKNIGKVISLSNSPVEYARKILSKCILFHEGWNVKTFDYKPKRKEIFLFCGIIILFEHPKAFKNVAEKISFFDYLLDLVFLQMRYDFHDFESVYNNPLTLLYFVSSQILTKKKLEYFIKKVILSCDSFQNTIKILQNDTIILSKSNMSLLHKRIKSEFELCHKQLIQKKLNDDVAFLEKQIEKFLK